MVHFQARKDTRMVKKAVKALKSEGLHRF